MVVLAQIVGAEYEEGVLFYHMLVMQDTNQWTVRRRYRDFVDFDQRLAAESGLRRLELPGKDVLGLRQRLTMGGFSNSREVALNRYLHHLSGQILSTAEVPAVDSFLGALAFRSKDECPTFIDDKGFRSEDFPTFIYEGDERPNFINLQSFVGTPTHKHSQEPLAFPANPSPEDCPTFIGGTAPPPPPPGPESEECPTFLHRGGGPQAPQAPEARAVIDLQSFLGVGVALGPTPLAPRFVATAAVSGGKPPDHQTYVASSRQSEVTSSLLSLSSFIDESDTACSGGQSSLLAMTKAKTDGRFESFPAAPGQADEGSNAEARTTAETGGYTSANGMVGARDKSLTERVDRGLGDAVKRSATSGIAVAEKPSSAATAAALRAAPTTHRVQGVATQGGAVNGTSTKAAAAASVEEKVVASKDGAAQSTTGVAAKGVTANRVVAQPKVKLPSRAECSGIFGETSEIAASPARFDNEAETVFRRLRRVVRAYGAMLPSAQASGGVAAAAAVVAEGSLEDLDSVAERTREGVWHFLVLVARQRPVLRCQAEEVAVVLEAREGWRATLAARPDLAAARAQVLDDRSRGGGFAVSRIHSVLPPR